MFTTFFKSVWWFCLDLLKQLLCLMKWWQKTYLKLCQLSAAFISSFVCHSITASLYASICSFNFKRCYSALELSLSPNSRTLSTFCWIKDLSWLFESSWKSAWVFMYSTNSLPDDIIFLFSFSATLMMRSSALRISTPFQNWSWQSLWFLYLMPFLHYWQYPYRHRLYHRQETGWVHHTLDSYWLS